MAANDHESTYDIGFSKPPKHSRFQKGVSGNPKGRPKGKRNLATVLEQTLQEKIVIDEGGVPRTVTKLEAAVKALVNLADSGDLGALRQLTALASSAEDQVVDPPTKQLPDADQKVMQGLLKRLQAQPKGEDDEDD